MKGFNAIVVTNQHIHCQALEDDKHTCCQTTDSHKIPPSKQYVTPNSLFPCATFISALFSASSDTSTASNTLCNFCPAGQKFSSRLFQLIVKLVFILLIKLTKLHADFAHEFYCLKSCLLNRCFHKILLWAFGYQWFNTHI